MFESSLDLTDVLKKLRHADEALTEFVAPLWPGVALAAVWLEGRPQLFQVTEPPAEEGLYLLGTEDGTSTVLRAAEAREHQRYLELLAKASVILLEDGFAFPATFAERLQGITGPRPIHFAEGSPLESVLARFDGLNLFYSRGKEAKQSSPLDALFGDTESSIFTTGELLGIPGEKTSGNDASTALADLKKHPDRAVEWALQGVLDPAGAVLEEWARVDGKIQFRWRRLDEEGTVTVAAPCSPITTGICLPGAQHFDPAALTRFLLEHALDAWR